MLRTALFRLQVQGMSFIAAVLILNLEEADAFIAFANLLNKPCQMAFFRVDHELVLCLHTQHVIDAQIISIVLKDKSSSVESIFFALQTLNCPGPCIISDKWNSMLVYY